MGTEMAPNQRGEWVNYKWSTSAVCGAAGSYDVHVNWRTMQRFGGAEEEAGEEEDKWNRKGAATAITGNYVNTISIEQRNETCVCTQDEMDFPAISSLRTRRDELTTHNLH